MDIDKLLKLADEVHGAAVRVTPWEILRRMGRYEHQELFRAQAIAAGVQDKTPEMGFVVTKCLSLSGYGS